MLRSLWDGGEPLTARQVQERVDGVALTTVMTALDRLRAKGEVRRIDEPGAAMRFTSARAEDEHVGLAMLARLDDSRDRGSALAHFVSALDEDGLDALRHAVRLRETW